MIELHRRNYKLSTKEEAKQSLHSIYEVPTDFKATKVDEYLLMTDTNKVENAVIYNKAVLLADRPERWIQLDYVMSQYPVNMIEVAALVSSWERKENVYEEEYGDIW